MRPGAAHSSSCLGTETNEDTAWTSKNASAMYPLPGTDTQDRISPFGRIHRPMQKHFLKAHHRLRIGINLRTSKKKGSLVPEESRMKEGVTVQPSGGRALESHACLFFSRTYSDTRRAAICAGLVENLCAQKEHTLRPLDFKSAQPKPKPSGLTCTFLAQPGNSL